MLAPLSDNYSHLTTLHLDLNICSCNVEYGYCFKISDSSVTGSASVRRWGVDRSDALPKLRLS